MATLDIKYDCHPTDGTPGEDFERFKVNAMNAASQADKRGYSLAETWLGTDEGGPAAGAPALPVNPAAVVVEATNARRARLKNAYRFITRHCLDAEMNEYLYNHHFNDGHTAWQYLNGQLSAAMTPLRLRELTHQWDNVNIITDIGVDEWSLQKAAKRLRTLNAKRPLANRFDENKLTERFLELIMDASKHFHIEATTEYTCTPATARFQHVVVPPVPAGAVVGAAPGAGAAAPPPGVVMRDFNSCLRTSTSSGRMLSRARCTASSSAGQRHAPRSRRARPSSRDSPLRRPESEASCSKQEVMTSTCPATTLRLTR